MKTERRHELQTNWLADRVNEAIVVTRPYMKALVGLLLAAIVLWGTYLYINHRAQAEEASGWNKLWDGLLGGPTASEDIQSLSESNAKRPTGEWAQLILADNELTGGVGSLFTEKSAGRNLITSALEGYRAVLNNSTDPLVRQHALYGIGRAQESLCKPKEAIEAYKQLRTDYPDSAYSPRAKQRLDDLSRQSTLERYDWLSRLEPRPNVFGKAGSGDNGMQLPPDLEPFSKFTPPASKTPPPEPTPDKGAAPSKEVGPKELAPKETPKKSKPGEEKTPATKSPEKTTNSDKTPETSPAIPKSTEAKPADKATSTTQPTTTAPTTTAPTTTAPTTTAPTTTAPTTPAPTTPPKPDDFTTPPPPSSK